MAEQSFAACLSEYCVDLGCTNKQLAEFCGISASTLSRYRSGERVPDPAGETLPKIAAGIVRAAEALGSPIDRNVEHIHARLAAGIERSRPDMEAYRNRLNDLMDTLSISNAEMARHAHIDPSFLSRIRSGQRFPAEPDEYARTFSLLVARRCSDADMARRLGRLLSGDELRGELNRYLASDDRDGVARVVEAWLLQGAARTASHLGRFLEFLDGFDLNEYIQTVHYDALKVPTMPVVIPASRFYYGLDGMREAELEFLKTTAMSRKAKEALLFSDMDMADLAGDGQFLRKYALGVAAMLKRGLRLNVIHDVMRPFDEMMMGLEGWIPLYMTGQVRPYYLKGPRDRVFGHLCNVSDVAALEGECVRGHHEDGRYQFMTKREELEYMGRRCRQLLDHATPLMQIYREDDTERFAHFGREERERRASGTGKQVGADVFRNMSIMAYGTELVVIEKRNDPHIAFVIRHPRLCEAIVSFTPSMREE